MTSSLAQCLEQTAYQSYLYSYPHKTAYRTLEPAVNLQPLWAQEDKSALFLYIHIPFCTMRCGFCNLFTLAQPRGDLAVRYVDQVIEQMRVTADVLEDHQFSNFACGGGTPSFLEASELERIFTSANKLLKLDLGNVPGCIEVAPDTVTTDRLAVCKDMGIDRVSMGLQSFYHGEIQTLVRKQSWQQVDGAIERIRAANFPILNLDLIYGIPGQTVASFLDTLTATLRYAPEELYLYPLYVRPLTGLDKIIKKSKSSIPVQPITHASDQPDLRLEMYSAARDFLRASGYEQVSMRMFRRIDQTPSHKPQINYSCQNDGMVGIGCGARSYTTSLHYSEEYGIARARISDILRSYCERDQQDFQTARYGIALNIQEQQRRFVIQSLLVNPGISFADFKARFGLNCIDTLPQLKELLALDLAYANKDGMVLTDKGMSYADVIGPWLISEPVNQLMHDYDLL